MDNKIKNWILTICGDDSDWIVLERLRGTSIQVAQHMFSFILADVDVFREELESMGGDDCIPKSIEDLSVDESSVEYELDMPEFYITYLAEIEQPQIDLTKENKL